MIKQKLLILFDNHVIDHATYNALLAILDYLLQQKIINDEQQADFFLTHLAMACKRHKNGEMIDFLDTNIKLEITQNTHYSDSQILWTQLANILQLELHQSEIDYIHLHLINFLNLR